MGVRGMSRQHRETKLKRLRPLALLIALLPASCAALSRNDQGPLQPQAVSGPCQVKKFFVLGLRTVPADMTIGNIGQACTFTMFNPNLQLVFSAALVTTPPAHGSAMAVLANSDRQVAVSYTPRSGYTGSDRFSILIEPKALGVTVDVTVQLSPPAP